LTDRIDEFKCDWLILSLSKIWTDF